MAKHKEVKKDEPKKIEPKVEEKPKMPVLSDGAGKGKF